MDLSKLPKLSQTPPPPDQAEPSPGGHAAGAPSPAKVELYCQCGAPITPGTNFCSHCGANYYQAVGSRAARSSDAGFGAGMWVEAFLSVAVGLFLMLMAPTGIKYLAATVTGKPFTPYLHPTDPGVYVDYQRFQDPQTLAITDYKYTDRFEHFWSDMAITTFALVLILEGIVMALLRNRWAALACAILAVAVTILNLWYLLASYTRVSPITRTTYGLAPMSALAVIFGVVMAGYQFRTYMELTPRRRR